MKTQNISTHTHTQESKDLPFPYSTCRTTQVVLRKPRSGVAVAFFLYSSERPLVDSCVAPKSYVCQGAGRRWGRADHLQSILTMTLTTTLENWIQYRNSKELAKFQGRKLAILAELTLTHIKGLWCGRGGENTKIWKVTKAYKKSLQGYVLNLSQILSILFSAIITSKGVSIHNYN